MFNIIFLGLFIVSCISIFLIPKKLIEKIDNLLSPKYYISIKDEIKMGKIKDYEIHLKNDLDPLPLEIQKKGEKLTKAYHLLKRK